MFFNDNLVKRPINKNKGSFIFINDYIAKVMRSSVVQNVNTL